MSESDQNSSRVNAETDKKDDGVEKGVRGKTRMDLLIFGFVALAAISGGFLSVFSYFGYWQNKETWAIWSFYCLIVFTVTAGFLTWQKRIWDSTLESVPVERNRPFVFFKFAALAEPLSPGKDPLIAFIVANTGPVEAQGDIKDATCFFNAPPPKNGVPRYRITPQSSFDLAPAAEVNAQARFPGMYLTEANITDKVEGRAQLYFFARGEYRDEAGRNWPLPFCRMYADDFPGKLVNCPDGFKIDNARDESVDTTPLRVGDRPYIGFTGLSIHLVQGKTTRFDISVSNTGNSQGLFNGYIYMDVRTDTTPNPQIDRSQEVLSQVTILPHQTLNAFCDLNKSLTMAELNAIERGDLNLFAYMEGLYTDGFGHKYFTHFCARYSPNSKTFENCNIYNDAN